LNEIGTRRVSAPRQQVDTLASFVGNASGVRAAVGCRDAPDRARSGRYCPGMKLRLNVLLERHADGNATASVLGLPREPAGGAIHVGGTTLRLGGTPVPGPFPIVSAVAAYGADEAELVRALEREVASRAGAADPGELAGYRFVPGLVAERVLIPVAAVDSEG